MSQTPAIVHHLYRIAMLARSAPVEAVEELPAALDDNFLNGLDFPSITNRDHAEKMLLAINARIA
jgi:hypothetical protein